MSRSAGLNVAVECSGQTLFNECRIMMFSSDSRDPADDEELSVQSDGRG